MEKAVNRKKRVDGFLEKGSIMDISVRFYSQ